MANTFSSEFYNNVGTSAQVVYTCTNPVLTATMIGMTVANTTNNQISVDVFVTRSSTNYYLVKGAIIVPGGALVPVGGDQKIVLEQSDTMSVVSNTLSSADVIVSVLEKT